jgi:hypothetical protein
MHWISQHSTEIALVLITALVTRALDYLFAKRVKLFYFFTNGAQFNIPNAPTSTLTLAVWNSGKATAENVRVTHYRLPNLYQVWPPKATTVENLPSGHQDLIIPEILPGEIVFVSYLEFITPLTPVLHGQIIVRVAAKDNQAKPMSFQFTRLYSQWFNRTVQVLFTVGAVVAVYYLFHLISVLLQLAK